MNTRALTEPQKFTSDVAWVAISQVLILLTGLAILSALTKSYPPEIYGVWVQIFVTVGLLTPILTFHLGTAMVRFLAGEEDRDKQRRALGTMLWPILAFACLLLLISLLLRQNLSIFLFAEPKYASFIPLAFLWASVEALFSFSLSYLRARGRIKRLSVIQLALAVVKMALIVILAVAGYSLEWIIVCLIIGQALFVAMVLGMIAREIGFPQPGFEGLKGYLAFSLPMLPTGALMWIINSSDRYFITHLLSLPQAGIYSASYILGSLVSLFWTPIGFVLFPTISKFWEQKDLAKVKSYFEYSTKLFLTLAIPAAAGLYMLSQPLLGIVTTAEFMVGGTLVLLVALGTVFCGLYNLNVYVIYLVQKTKWLPFIFTIGAVTNALINIILIPKVGIIGAAISTIVSYFVLSAIITVWARRAISYKMDFKFISKVVLATLLMVFCLRFIEIGSALSIVLAVIVGVAIFSLGLLLLKAFSKQDRRLIREAFSGLNPKLWRGISAGKHRGSGRKF